MIIKITAKADHFKVLVPDTLRNYIDGIYNEYESMLHINDEVYIERKIFVEQRNIIYGLIRYLSTIPNVSIGPFLYDFFMHGDLIRNLLNNSCVNIIEPTDRYPVSITIYREDPSIIKEKKKKLRIIASIILNKDVNCTNEIDYDMDNKRYHKITTCKTESIRMTFNRRMEAKDLYTLLMTCIFKNNINSLTRCMSEEQRIDVFERYNTFALKIVNGIFDGDILNKHSNCSCIVKYGFIVDDDRKIEIQIEKSK